MTLLPGIFAVIFIGGSLVFCALARLRPSRGVQHALLVSVAVCGMFGLGLRYGFAPLWGRETGVAIACILGLWMAWIGVPAPGAQALRQAERGSGMRRWTAVPGAVGTTVPWFGLAWADVPVG